MDAKQRTRLRARLRVDVRAQVRAQIGARSSPDLRAVWHPIRRIASRGNAPYCYLRRCQRVFFSILRCLCLDAFFLRHFLTDPTIAPPFLRIFVSDIAPLYRESLLIR